MGKGLVATLPWQEPRFSLIHFFSHIQSACCVLGTRGAAYTWGTTLSTVFALRELTVTGGTSCKQAGKPAEEEMNT